MSKSKIRATYIGVALIAMLLLFNLINKENTKMDPYAGTLYLDTNTGKIMQYNGSGYSGGGGGGGGGGAWGASYSEPTSSSTSGFPSYSEAEVLGTSTSEPTYSSYTSGSIQQSQAPAPPPDPYAQWGGRSAYNALTGEITQNKDNIVNSAGMSREAQFNQGRSSILDFIDDAKLTQEGIDQKRKNAQFSLQAGKGDIMEMVGRGIRSGGVMLANKNAASSGAAGQIARAYGELGNRENRDVNNQFELENQGIDLEQNNLTTGFDKQKRKIDEFKISQTDNIVNKAKADLAALDAQRIGASLPELFQIDQIAQEIKDATMARLGELDTLLQTKRAEVNPISRQQVLAGANQMRTAGTGGPQMFDFNTNAPDIRTAGPSVAGAELPIYSNLALNRRREV